MSRSPEQKIRLLVLYDILKSESDEERPLSTNELIEKLAEYGITATRQTIYDDIEMLNAFGYEILCDHGRNNRYFVGDRAFELPEVQILLHAVGASKSLSGKKSAVLTDKIAELLGNVQADKVKDLLTENECEYGNEANYYSIDTITTALIEKHKLSFLYFDIGSKGERIYRKGKERYEVNPLGMVYSGECFYLVCFHDKYGNPASYRIDKMEDVQVEELAKGGCLPARKDFFDNEYFDATPQYEVLKEALEVSHTPYSLKYDEMYTPILDNMQRCLNQEVTPEEAVNTITEQINALLAE